VKLVTYVQQGEPRLGAISDGQVIELAQAWDAYRRGPDDSAGQRDSFPADVSALLQSDDATWQSVRNVVAWAETLPDPEGGRFRQPLDQVRLAAPVANPSKIMCVGLNYYDHCREQDIEVPERPVLFAKFPSSIIGPGEEITWSPDTSQQVDYEAELAVVIGRQGRNIPVEQAYDYVAGYTIVNDVSARDAQFADDQWIRGKSFDTFCPMGPYLLTADEVPDPHTLDIRCWVNGELRQESNTRELIFKVHDLVAYISKTSTLMPGDVLITGTPGGVGVFRDPQVFLKPGDLVEIEIETLGRLRNRVR
jgi:2-keto-4-pentenoate hydratase/2-oxohepta-3-ene-1,7-dioic acid hydratase in catechol pathway